MRKKSKRKKADLRERFTKASLEGIAVELLLDAVVPGAGLTTNVLSTAKGLKKVAKVAGKGATKEGAKTVLDDEENNTNELEEIGEDLALKVFSQAREH